MDATDEETFSLDTFDRLIQRSHARGKSFLIARVSTADPHDPNRLYHSHYSAHQINKVLFRTQPELSLLHRMKSHNPLNNMPIVGDVDYYMIDKGSVEQAMKQLHMETTKEELNRPGMSNAARKHKRTLSDSGYTEDAKNPSGLHSPQINSYQSSIHDVVSTDTSTTNLLKMPVALEKKRIQYVANFFATDDDFLMKNETREIFKNQAVNADDYMLFTLHSNNQMGANGDIIVLEQQAPRVPRIPSSWKNLWGSINTTPTASLTNKYTGFLTNRGLGIFFAFYLVAAIGTLKYCIPIEYIYLVGFLFAFVFVLILVLFVEAGIR